MDLWQLHIFCKVVELKSFSKAGEAVHLSQPTVSSHIKDLETHFSCRLIDRLAREVSPTKAGELLYGYARKLLLLKEETETAMAEFHGKIRGRLLVGGSTIPGVHVLPKVVGAFVKRYPEVTLSLVIGDTETIVNHCAAGTLEMGIVGAKSSDRQVRQETLIEDEMCLVVPPNGQWSGRSSLFVADLFEMPFILRETGSGTLQSFQESLKRLGHSLGDLKVVAEMGSSAAVVQGVKNGVGCSIVSRIAVAEDLDAGALRTVAVIGLDLKRRFYLTTHRYKSPSPLSKTFVAFLKEILKDGI